MQNSLRRNRMLRQPLFFWSGYLSIQFFNLNTHVTDLRDAMPRQRSLTRTHMWLTGRHATPEVTLHIPHPPCHPHSPVDYRPVFTNFILSAQPSAEWFATYLTTLFFLGKRRISREVISILSMYLRLHA